MNPVRSLALGITTGEGYYTPAATPGGTEQWHSIRILNGDQTDRGIHCSASSPSAQHPIAVRITLGRF